MRLMEMQRSAVEQNMGLVGKVIKDKVHRIGLGILIPVLCAVLTLALFKTVLIIGYVPSESMEPTIHANSFVLGLRLYGELETGDIIIFWHDGKLLVKRIAAVGGETVIHAGESLTVPAGCYYVLGDKAENSMDSRYWKDPFVREENVTGRVKSSISPR